MENETKEITPIFIETDTTEVFNTSSASGVKKGRNYSFKHRSEDTLDSVEVDEDKTYVIPAQPGSAYWAILRIVYEYADTPMTSDDIIDEVADLLESRDPDKWEKYKNKGSITTHKNGQQVRIVANGWRKRMETNIKTLTRSGGGNPYGNRITERGHILRWEPELLGGKGAFILRTDTNQPLAKKRNAKKDKEVN